MIKKITLSAAIGVAISLMTSTTFAQNVGIGTASPNTKLDVNGAISAREGTAFSNTQFSIVPGPYNDLALPSGNSFFRIPSGLSNLTANFIVNGIAGGHDGQQLIIANQSGYTMTLSNLSTSNASAIDQILIGNGISTLVIPTGSIVSFIYSKNISNSSSTGAWVVTATQTGTVTSVTAGSAPIIVTGTATAPVISIQGTNTNQGGVLYSAGTGNTAAFSIQGTGGYVLQSNGSGAPTWVNPATAANAWNLTGNSGTTAGTNFIGTTNANDLVFKTAGLEDMRIDNSTGNVGIGTGASPAQKLTVTQTADADKYVISSSAMQTSLAADYQNVAVYGYAKGGNNNFGYGVGVMGIVHPTSHGGVGLYGGIATSAPTIGTSKTFYGVYTDVGSVNGGTTGYAAAFMNGNVGIGTATPTQTLEIGSTSGTIRIDGLKSGNSFNTTANSNSNLVFANKTTGDLSALANGSGVLNINGSGVPTWSALDISTSSVTGLLPVGNGGTGIGTLTSKGIIYGNGSSAVGITAAGSQGQILTVNSSNVPVWSTATYPATTTANQLLYSSSNNTVTGLPVGGGGTVLTSVSGVPTWLPITATTVGGWALTGNGSTTPGTNYIGTSDANDMVFKSAGNESMRLSNSTGNVVIGSGEGGSAVGTILRAPYNSSGGNRTGADFTIAAGAPTGKGGSGSIIFQELAPNIGSAGNSSDLSIMAEAMRITNTGALSFGATGAATGNGNNVLISGGSTTNPKWGQLPLNDATNAVTGTLGVGNGGTGASSLTSNGLLIGNGASAVSSVNGTTGQVLVANSSNVPTFVNMSGDATISSTGVVTVSTTPSGNGYIKNQSSSSQSASFYISGPASIGTAPASNTAFTLNSTSAVASTGISATSSSFAFTTAIAGQVSSFFGGTGVSGYSPAGAGSNIGVAGYYGAVPGTLQSSGVFGASNSNSIPAIYAYNSNSSGPGLTVNGTTDLQNNTTEDENLSITGNLSVINGVSYTWPTVTPTPNQVLTYNGTNLVWNTPATSSGWTLTGNGGTTAGTNFIGTSDATDFVVKTGTTPTERMHFVNSSGNVVIGSGEGTGTVTGNTLRAPNAAGSNISGVDFTIAGGNGTGTGGSGDVVFQTAPIGSAGTTANTLAERMRIFYNGNIIIGSGEGSATTAGNILRAPNASGTNIAGTDFTIAGGDGTGTGGGGDVVFQTAPVGSAGTAANTLAERMRINFAGNVIIGSGEASSVTTGGILRAPSIAVGNSNKVGADLTITSGNGTGNGGSGNIIFQTAPTGASSTTAINTMTEVMRITPAGIVAIGTTLPASDAGIAIKDGHVQLQQTTAPTITIGAAAGSATHSAAASLSNATDVAGAAKITTASSGTLASGVGATITFHQVYITAPIVVITPTDATTAAAMNSLKIFVNSSATVFTINFGAVATNGTSYNFNYMVLETQ